MKSRLFPPIFGIALLIFTSPYFPLCAADQFLDACLQIAEARDKKLAVAQGQLELAKTRVLRTGRAFFPSVMVQRRSSRGKTFDFTSTISTGTTISEEYQGEDFGIRASQPIYEGGRQSASYRYENLMVDASRYNYTKTREELFAKVKLAYYEYLSLRMEYTALKKAFTEINALMDKVRVEYKAKAIAELDLMEAQNLKDKLENLFKNSGLNLTLAEKKLTTLVNVGSIDDVPVLMPEGLMDNVPEISFSLKECLGFIAINNLDLKNAQVQILMNAERKKIARSKVLPKLYAEAYYGQSGEAFVTEPLELATVWSLTGRMQWGLWGNTAEAVFQHDKTNPNELIDPTTRTDNSTYELRLGLFDDVNYFVESKESRVGYQQSQADYNEILNKLLLDLEKTYSEYDISLRNARTLKNEIELHRRKLELLRKRNDLYEVPTVSVMEESWKYGETISSYAQSLYINYASVTEMERMTLVPLR